MAQQGLSRAQIEDAIKWLAEGGFEAPGEKIAIHQDPAEETIGEAGIILAPETSQFKPHRGTIVMIGNAVKEDQLKGLKIGDRTIFNRYSPIVIDLVDRYGNKLPIIMVHPHNVYVRWPYGFGVREPLGGDSK